MSLYTFLGPAPDRNPRVLLHIGNLETLAPNCKEWSCSHLPVASLDFLQNCVLSGFPYQESTYQESQLATEPHLSTGKEPDP